MNYKLNSYLSFDGNCEEAFSLYAKAFGGEARFMRAEGVPGIPAEMGNKILHTQLEISGGDTLMGSDSFPMEGSPAYQPGNNQSVCITPPSKEEADRLFAILSEGGSNIMPMSEQFFGYFGCFIDRFGINWMIVIPNECEVNR